MRRGRPEKAFSLTKRTIVDRWWDSSFSDSTRRYRINSPDIDFANQLEVPVLRDNGRTLLNIAPKVKKRFLGRFRQKLLYETYAAGYGGGDTFVPPDAVIAAVMDDGREVFLHTFQQRVFQRMCQLTLEPIVEPFFAPGSHAYRPGRSRYTAQAYARHLVRLGYHFAVSGDIRRFFSSVSTGLLEKVLVVNYPQIGAELREALLWSCCPHVIYRPSHPRRKAGSLPLVSPPLRHLLPGSVIGPLCANIVGHELIDKPMAELMPEVRIVRYADDFLILAKSLSGAEEARWAVAEVLSIAGLSLHPEKGQVTPIDLKRERLKFLGKYLHGGEVITPEDAIDRHVERISTASLASPRFRSAVGSAVADLCLDRRKRLRYLQRKLYRRSRLYGAWFETIASTVPGQPGEDHPEDIHDQGVVALANATDHQDDELCVGVA